MLRKCHTLGLNRTRATKLSSKFKTVNFRILQNREKSNLKVVFGNIGFIDFVQLFWFFGLSVCSFAFTSLACWLYHHARIFNSSKAKKKLLCDSVPKFEAILLLAGFEIGFDLGAKEIPPHHQFRIIFASVASAMGERWFTGSSKFTSLVFPNGNIGLWSWANVFYKKYYFPTFMPSKKRA